MTRILINQAVIDTEYTTIPTMRRNCHVFSIIISHFHYCKHGVISTHQIKTALSNQEIFCRRSKQARSIR